MTALYSNGLPVQSYPLTGNEMVVADTGVGSGAGPSQVAISSQQIHLYAAAPVTLPYASTVTLDASQGSAFTVTPTGNFTLALANLPAGRVVRLKVLQDATGSRTITAYPANVRWPGGTAPTLTTTAAHYDILTFFNDGVNIDGSSALNYTT